MSEPRVLLITYSRPETARGGVETFSRHLSRVFPGLEYLTADDLDVNLSTGRFRELRLLRALAREAARRHLKQPYDLIVANGSLAMALPESFPGRFVPVMVVMHGNYPGYCRAAMKPWHPKTLYTRWVASRWERKSAQRADVVVAVSAGVGRDVRRHFGCDPLIVHNGVEMTDVPVERSAARRMLELAPGRPVVAFVGRPTYEKGYDRLLRLAASRPAYQFVTATPTAPRTVASDARAFIDPDPDTLSAIYRACDVLCFPSRFEGCAYAPLEAMAAGTPVVGSATGVFDDLSGAFAGGWIVRGDRPEDWQRAVDEVLRTRHHFDPAGYVRTRFSFETFVRGYREIAAALAPAALTTSLQPRRQPYEEEVREVRVA